MNRIKKVSYFFNLIFQLILLALPILLITSWIYAPNELVLLSGGMKINAIPPTYNDTHIYTPGGIAEKSILHTLSTTEKIAGCLVSGIPMIMQILILYFLIKLFSLYEKGKIFSLQHVKYLRNIGYILLIKEIIIEPLYQFAMRIVLTIHNPPHHRYASITFDQTNMGIILVGSLIILISWIMAEGYKLQEEQQLTI